MNDETTPDQSVASAQDTAAAPATEQRPAWLARVNKDVTQPMAFLDDIKAQEKAAKGK